MTGASSAVDRKMDGSLPVKEDIENGGSHVIVVGVMKGGECGSEDDEELCRICHLNTQETGGLVSSGLIRIGCRCKGELGFVHRDCGEAWFKLKKNRYCEICGMTAKNITGEEHDSSFMEEWHEGRVPDIDRNRLLPATRASCSTGFCNFFTVCLIICFMAAWVMHKKLF